MGEEKKSSVVRLTDFRSLIQLTSRVSYYVSPFAEAKVVQESKSSCMLQLLCF